MKSNKAVAYGYAEEKPMIQEMTAEDLHTTLPMDELISLFESEIREIITYDSFEYEHAQKSIHVFRGSPKRHKCQYIIKASEMELGQITLTRRKPFKEEEMLVVERALGALSVHLNNAIDHQSSLLEEDLTELRVETELSNIE